MSLRMRLKKYMKKFKKIKFIQIIFILIYILLYSFIAVDTYNSLQDKNNIDKKVREYGNEISERKDYIYRIVFHILELKSRNEIYSLKEYINELNRNSDKKDD